MARAIEAFVCPLSHPMCEAIALEAVAFVRQCLPSVLGNGADLEARGKMQLAAAMASVAAQKGLGAAHSLSHPLSSDFGIQHGLANALALPHVVRFNNQADSASYTRVAWALGIKPAAAPAAQVADFLLEFNRSIGITTGLGKLGVPPDKLPALSAKAFEDPCHETNLRPCTEADLLGLYEAMW